jgi:hypothetical protein
MGSIEEYGYSGVGTCIGVLLGLILGFLIGEVAWSIIISTAALSVLGTKLDSRVAPIREIIAVSMDD